MEIKPEVVAKLVSLDVEAAPTRIQTHKCLRFLESTPGIANALSVCKNTKLERQIIRSVDKAIVELLGRAEGAAFSSMVREIDDALKALEPTIERINKGSITEITWDDVKADFTPAIDLISHYIVKEQEWFEVAKNRMTEAKEEEIASTIHRTAAAVNEEYERARVAVLDRAAFKAQKRAEKERLKQEQEEMEEAAKLPKANKKAGGKKKNVDDDIQAITKKLSVATTTTTSPALGATTPLTHSSPAGIQSRKPRATSAADPSMLAI